MQTLTQAQAEAVRLFEEYGPRISYIQQYQAFAVPGTSHKIQVNTIKALIQKKILKGTRYIPRGHMKKKVLFEAELISA